MNMHGRERERCVRTFEMVETEALRPRIEAAINTLLALLDELDGDADLEPSFGELRPGAADEAEEDDPGEDGADCEPWLGSIEFYPTQAPCYAAGWDQSRWGCSGRSDRESDAGDEPEHDDADLGIADFDALHLIESAGLPPVCVVRQW